MAESIVKPWLFEPTLADFRRGRPLVGPDASSKRVRVHYRKVERADLPPDEHVTVETMSHEGYWKWIGGPLKRGEVVMLKAETVEDA